MRTFALFSVACVALLGLVAVGWAQPYTLVPTGPSVDWSTAGEWDQSGMFGRCCCFIICRIVAFFSLWWPLFCRPCHSGGVCSMTRRGSDFTSLRWAACLRRGEATCEFFIIIWLLPHCCRVAAALLPASTSWTPPCPLVCQPRRRSHPWSDHFKRTHKSMAGSTPANAPGTASGDQTASCGWSDPAEVAVTEVCRCSNPCDDS